MTEASLSSQERVRRAAAEAYAADPADFTSTRTAAVRRARQDGDKEAVDLIGRLRKPSVAAWCLNQVVRREPDAVSALVNLGGRLRHATATMDAAGLTSLRGVREEALDGLDAAAVAVALTLGRPLTDGVRAEVRATAIAALADPAAEQVAYSGALTRALHYSGFGEVDILDAVARTATGVPLAVVAGGGQHEGDGHEDNDTQSGEKKHDEQKHDAAGTGDPTPSTAREAEAARALAQEALTRAEREQRIAAARAERAATRARSTAERVAALREEVAVAQAEADAAAAEAAEAERAHDRAVQEQESAAQVVQAQG